MVADWTYELVNSPPNDARRTSTHMLLLLHLLASLSVSPVPRVAYEFARVGSYVNILSFFLFERLGHWIKGGCVPIKKPISKPQTAKTETQTKPAHHVQSL
jgi:hypothetical protein